MPSLSGLDPRFRPYAEALLKYARAVDPRFVVTSARRSRMAQARLYAKWKAGQSAFPAYPPGTSLHERGLAVDIARMTVDPQDDELLAELGRMWREAGGIWGGEKDPVHFGAPRSWA